MRSTLLAAVVALVVLVVLVAAGMMIVRDDDSSGNDGVQTSGDDPGPAPPPGGDGTLAVDLEPIEGHFIEGFDVTLRFYGPNGDLVAEREWTEAVSSDAGDGDIEAYYSYVLREAVPAGQVRLVSYMRISPGDAIPPPEEPGCETTVHVAPADAARVTLLFDADPAAGSACAALTSATAAADELLALPRGLPAPGFVGLSEDEAAAEAGARGWSIRVVARDGEALIRTEDYSTERVNLVLQDGIVTAAARS